MFTGDTAVVAEARAGRSYRSRAAGFAGIIGKPFAIDDLLATVKAAVDGSPQTDLFGMAIHELRQPLTVIRGQLQLARRHVGEDPESERRTINLTLTQVDRMGDMIDQLLDEASLAAARGDPMPAARRS